MTEFHTTRIHDARSWVPLGLSSFIVGPLVSTDRAPKKDIKKFTNKLLKENRFPKQKGLSIKSKYVVQTDLTFPSFKIFLNTNKKVSQNYVNFFTKEFRDYFNLIGVPLNLTFMRSKNPFQIK